MIFFVESMENVEKYDIMKMEKCIMGKNIKQTIANELYFFDLGVNSTSNIAKKIDEVISTFKRIVYTRGNINFTDVTFNHVKNYLMEIIIENELENTLEWKSICDIIMIGSNEVFDEKKLSVLVINLEKIKQCYLIKDREEKYTEFILNHLHQRIRKVSIHQFQNRCYADSVENACKDINERLKAIYKKENGIELDGDSLFTSIFSPNNPIIKLEDISTQSGKNVQKGYMLICQGMWSAIRDPKAHKNIDITKEDALEKLFLMSLIMHKIDAGIKFTGLDESY